MRNLRSTLCIGLLFILCWGGLVNAQNYNPNALPNTYQSEQNPLYWKNNPPYKGYWQQDVAYKINATLDDQSETIRAELKLEYTNNSPHELNEAYFHLYQNAFQPESYLAELKKRGKVKVTYGEYESLKLGTQIHSFQYEGKPIEYHLDNTLLKVVFDQPIPSGKTVTFDIVFTTYFDKGDMGNIRRRMKTFYHHGYKHFDGVHWYPRIAVYDRKFGWTTDQHLGKEFYGDFGTFDVAFTFPSQYVMEATGTLLNRDEVLPADLRKKLDVSNFKTPVKEISKPIKEEGTKTWHWYAENVHDFAFTADPTYRIGEAEWNGVKCIALVQEQNAHGWQETADYIARVIKTFSEDFGMFEYPKIVAADARDGMEYPMITLDGGSYPGHRYLIAHEVGHNWFYGMINNNETYRAGLDEGFTQFLTAWAMAKELEEKSLPSNSEFGSVFLGYLFHAIGENNAKLNIHSDHYHSAERHGGGYSQVYYKTATMLYNLAYIMGEELFSKCMKSYVAQWKMAHPYWDDFRKSMVMSSQMDLNWFFDQWINTNEKLDYGIQCVKKDKTDQGYAYSVTFKRKEEMVMPLYFTTLDEAGKSKTYFIPNKSYPTKFLKSLQSQGITVLPKWEAWGLLYPTHEVTINLENKMKQLVIDPTGRLADIYRLDNKWKKKTTLYLDNFKHKGVDINNYQMTVRPDFWYNATDGLKAGIHLDGNYFTYRHKLDFRMWYNTELGAHDFNQFYTFSNNVVPISYYLTYADKMKNDLNWHVNTSWNAGIIKHQLGLGGTFKNANWNIYIKSLVVPWGSNNSYFHYPQFWNKNMYNNTLNLDYKVPFNYIGGNGSVNLGFRGSVPLSDYKYAGLKLEVKNTNNFWRMKLNSRLFGQILEGQIAPESRLFLAGANNEEMLQNKFTRATGFFPPDYYQYSGNTGHFHQGGGLNLRGYSNYIVVKNNGADTFFMASGNQGVSCNFELDFQNVFGWRFNKIRKYIKLRTYLFADAGVLVNGKYSTGLNADAGLGTNVTINWGKLNKAKPLTIRVDFPMVLNRPPSVENYSQLRYVIGIGKAF